MPSFIAYNFEMYAKYQLQKQKHIFFQAAEYVTIVNKRTKIDDEI